MFTTPGTAATPAQPSGLRGDASTRRQPVAEPCHALDASVQLRPIFSELQVTSSHVPRLTWARENTGLCCWASRGPRSAAGRSRLLSLAPSLSSLPANSPLYIFSGFGFRGGRVAATRPAARARHCQTPNGAKVGCGPLAGEPGRSGRSGQPWQGSIGILVPPPAPCDPCHATPTPLLGRTPVPSRPPADLPTGRWALVGPRRALRGLLDVSAQQSPISLEVQVPASL